jgi:serine/threonine-protein kinase
MSPEQCRGEHVDQQADIYSLGCVLFEAMIGEPPFVGKDPVDTILKQVSPALPTFQITCENQKVADQLEKVLLRSLAKSKEHRYATMAHFLEDLLQFRELLAKEGVSVSISR